ncbi:MAG: hypothetical protein IAI49_14760 [Candidatus Eremiobacteraeota bacterium]|nr:hypothetical protein [Candidatus Eremiobacteraeota bacterium]
MLPADSADGASGAGQRRFDESAIHFWYRKNAEWLYLGVVLAITGALWLDASEQRTVAALVSTFNVDHKSECANQRARLQTALNFWDATSGYRRDHADHEMDASAKWAFIVGDLERERIGDTQLHADIDAVSRKWRELATDDYADADRSRQHEHDLQGEYDETCGDTPPTPQPASKRKRPEQGEVSPRPYASHARTTGAKR